MPKVLFQKYKKVTSTIDPQRHAAKLKEIEEHVKEFTTELELEELEEEEMGSEVEESELSLSEGEPSIGIGRIDLSFPETIAEFQNHPQCYPPSYYTLSSKERLLLLYAENFRKQFAFSHPKRRPLVLAVPNECNVQKFVCTTLRPTAFVFSPLITSLKNIADFVSDFIQYEPLDDPNNLPTRLMSPDTLLRTRCGNSFEIATLLASMLIGAGHPAMVVSGVAREATVLNDQKNVPYPYPIEDEDLHVDEIEVAKTGQKYKLRQLPDLESHLEEEMAQVLKQKAEEEKLIEDGIKKKQIEELELLAVDRYHYRRSHAWVVVINNAPWSVKPRITYTDVNGDVVEATPTGVFIEPSTGFICETKCKQYILVDSVWNEDNYYINKQTYKRVGEIRWDLRNTSDWEHLLPGEPPEMRVHKVASDENIVEEDFGVGEEKHLDAIWEWVNNLHIGSRDFEQRFPNGEKKDQYKGAIHERFAPYSQSDGKIMQLSIYNDDGCTDLKDRYEYYENRFDHMKQLKYKVIADHHKEFFSKGREDSLKSLEYYSDSSQTKKLSFYPNSRLDCLDSMEVNPGQIIALYKDRSDRCWHKEFDYNAAGGNLIKVTEKFHQSTIDELHSSDVATRTFLFQHNKIILKFHYTFGALTPSTVEFTKPSRPEYGKELIYDEKLVKMYRANPLDPTRTNLELYRMLLEQLQSEERIKKEFEKTQEEVIGIFDIRKTERSKPKLKFSIFDSQRNGAARAIRMQQFEEEQEYKREVASKPADFLAPYLVQFKHQEELTHQQSLAIFNDCLNDLKTRFVKLLNNLQRQYEDLSSEAKSLKQFINKFENQFDNHDYNRLVEQAKDMELRKRMVQQRLTLTHEESQKKYEWVKSSLLKDRRLNLKLNDEIDA